MQLLPLLERARRYALPLVAGAMLAGTAVAKDIRIAHVYSKYHAMATSATSQRSGPTTTPTITAEREAGLKL